MINLVTDAAIDGGQVSTEVHVVLESSMPSTKSVLGLKVSFMPPVR